MSGDPHLWRRKKFWIALVSFVFIVLWVSSRLFRNSGAGKPGSAPATLEADAQQLPLVTVAQPLRKPAAVSIALPASVEAFEQATLYAKVTGYLQWIHVDKGDRVRKGEVIALLEVPEVEREYQSAQAAVQQAQAEQGRAQAQSKLKALTYERLSEVRRLKPAVLPQQEVDSARAGYEVARGDVELAQAKIQLARAELARLDALREFAKIQAPFSGTVTARFADPGALIQQGGNSTGNPIVTVASVGTVRVYIYVPEPDVSHVRRGLPVEVTLDAFPGSRFPGRVTRFADALDPQARTMKTEIDLRNPRRQILPGMYGTADLQLSRESAAFFLPDASILRDAEGRPFVFTVVQDRIRKVAIQTGLDDGNLSQVTGLTGDESIVLATTANLQEGLAVKAVKKGS